MILSPLLLRCLAVEVWWRESQALWPCCMQRAAEDSAVASLFHLGSEKTPPALVWLIADADKLPVAAFWM